MAQGINGLSKIKFFCNILIKKPILAIYDTTKLCNQRCPMCNVYKNSSEQMSLSEIETVAQRLSRFGIGYVFIQGGEPLLRKEIIEIIDIFIKYSIKPTVITNGVLLNKALAEKIAQRKCNLSISIDSFDKEKYAYLRGSNDFEKVIENINSLSSVCNRKGNWSITSTITKKSDINDIKRIKNFAESNNFMYAIRPYITVTGVAGKVNCDLKYSHEDIIEIFEYFKNAAKKENYLAYLVYCEHIRYIKGEKMNPCDAMKFSFLIGERGDIAPCIEMPNKKIQLDNFKKFKKEYLQNIKKCNCEHPCFYNDAREIGVLYRNIPKIILNSPKIIAQLKRFKNFF